MAYLWVISLVSNIDFGVVVVSIHLVVSTTIWVIQITSLKEELVSGS